MSFDKSMGNDTQKNGAKNKNGGFDRLRRNRTVMVISHSFTKLTDVRKIK